MNRLLQGIIFDVDGTLADTEEVHRQAFNLTFADFGLDWEWTPALYEQLLCISGGRERMLVHAHEVDPVRAADPQFPDFIRRLHEAKTVCYAGLLRADGVRLRPGVERVLHEARREGLKLGIATSSAWSNLKTLLDNNLPPEWPSWFSAIETADSVAEKKPSPAVYEAVIRRAQFSPDRTLALEDTRNGLMAARAAGLTTVITAHRFTRHHSFDGAAAVLDGLGDAEHPTAVIVGPPCEQDFVDLRYLMGLMARAEDSTPAPVQGRLSYG